MITVLGTMALGACIALGACATGRYAPPQSLVPDAAPLGVEASVDRTWDAAVTVLAESEIPVRNSQRASGLIETERVPIAANAYEYADCGKVNGVGPLKAARASYTLRIRGDSAKATVQVTASFTPPGNLVYECVSTGAWEHHEEAVIKARAEGRAVPTSKELSAAPDPCSLRDTVERDGDDWRVRIYRTDQSSSCTVKKECRYIEAALNSRREDALTRCRVEAKYERER